MYYATKTPRALVCEVVQDLSYYGMGISYGPYLLCKDPQCRPLFVNVYSGVILGFEAFRKECPYYGTTGSTSNGAGVQRLRSLGRL